MTRLAVSRMFRSAILSAIDSMYSDPLTMKAIELLADGFRDIPTMLQYLWDYNDSLDWGSILGIEYSHRKQVAVLTVTGKNWSDWLKLYAAK